MIHSVKFNLLRNDEHIQLNQDLLYIFDQANPETLKIKVQYDDLKAGTLKMETAYLQLRGSELTKKIEEQDAVRDNHITGIEKYAEAHTHHYNEALVEAGTRLLSHIQKYGKNVARMNYQAETTALTDLISDSKNDDKLLAAVTSLTLTEWFTKLEESNIEFHRLFMLRVNDEAGKPKLDLKELRNESIAHYRELTKHLSSHATITPSDLYDSTINKINELIDKYNALRR